MALNILCIGIEPTVYALIRGALEGRGHQVAERIAWDARTLSVDAMNVDLVICEIDVDDEQPMMILQKLQRPVVAISRDPGTFHRNIRLQWAYLSKPLRIRHLIELVEEAGAASSPGNGSGRRRLTTQA